YVRPRRLKPAPTSGAYIRLPQLGSEPGGPKGLLRFAKSFVWGNLLSVWILAEGYPLRHGCAVAPADYQRDLLAGSLVEDLIHVVNVAVCPSIVLIVSPESMPASYNGVLNGTRFELPPPRPLEPTPI